jgi:hypothetical protein
LLAAFALASLNACATGGAIVGSNAQADRSSDTGMRRSLSLLSTGIITTAQPSPIAMTETPLASDALADSIGVNTHVSLTYGDADYPAQVAALHALGVRYIRDGILNADAAYDAAMLQMLGTKVKLDGITACAGVSQNVSSVTSPASIEQFFLAVGGRLASVEGPNEVDAQGDPTWAQDTLACLPALRTAVTSVPFVGPSLADSMDDGSSLGNIASLEDYGNFHRYFSGRNPGTPGWGGTFACGVYGALAWAICEAQINSGSKPLLVTETGYNSQNEVDETTQAKYLARMFLVNLQAGIVKSYVYDLCDDASDPNFGGDGLLRVGDTAKPAFTAIQSELAYFSDLGSAPSSAPLSYALTNTSLDHLLFRKRDGSYVLALWNETASWDPNEHVPIIVAPQSQTVSFTQAPASVSAMTIGDTGTLVTTPTVVSGHAVQLAVDDHVTLLHFSLR